MKIYYNVTILKYLKDTAGITLYPFILIYFPKEDPRATTLLKHEMVHVDQVRRMGWLKFYIVYIYYHFRYGYAKNPLEVEAVVKSLY